MLKLEEFIIVKRLTISKMPRGKKRTNDGELVAQVKVKKKSQNKGVGETVTMIQSNKQTSNRITRAKQKIDFKAFAEKGVKEIGANNNAQLVDKEPEAQLCKSDLKSKSSKRSRQKSSRTDESNFVQKESRSSVVNKTNEMLFKDNVNQKILDNIQVEINSDEEELDYDCNRMTICVSKFEILLRAKHSNPGWNVNNLNDTH